MCGFRAQRYEVPEHVSILVTETGNSVHKISEPMNVVHVTYVTAEPVSKETCLLNTGQCNGKSSEI